MAGDRVLSSAGTGSVGAMKSPCEGAKPIALLCVHRAVSNTGTGSGERIIPGAFSDSLALVNQLLSSLNGMEVNCPRT